MVNVTDELLYEISTKDLPASKEQYREIARELFETRKDHQRQIPINDSQGTFIGRLHISEKDSLRMAMIAASHKGLDKWELKIDSYDDKGVKQLTLTAIPVNQRLEFPKDYPEAAMQELDKKVSEQLPKAKHADVSCEIDGMKIYNHIPPVVEASLRALEIIAGLNKEMHNTIAIGTLECKKLGDVLKQREEIYNSAMKHVQDYLEQE